MREQPRILDELPVHPGAPPDTEVHHLRIRGLIDRWLDLDEEQLTQHPQSALTEDFACEEGWLVPKLGWRGVLVGALLDVAGAVERGRWVEFAAGEFRFTLPIEEARAALVALTLDGAPLSREHGGPMRLVVPGAACFTSIKWLDRIEVWAQPGPNVAREIALERLRR